LFWENSVWVGILCWRIQCIKPSVRPVAPAIDSPRDSLGNGEHAQRQRGSWWGASAPASGEGRSSMGAKVMRILVREDLRPIQGGRGGREDPGPVSNLGRAGADTVAGQHPSPPPSHRSGGGLRLKKGPGRGRGRNERTGGAAARTPDTGRPLWRGALGGLRAMGNFHSRPPGTRGGEFGWFGSHWGEQ